MLASIESEKSSAELDKSYIARKQEMVIKDFESAASAYHHYMNEVSTLRNWNITLLLAYVGLLITRTVSDNAILVPLFLIPIPFIFLELFVRGHLVFLAFVIQEIGDLFMTRDNAEFARKLDCYKFKDLRLAAKPENKPISTMLRYSIVSSREFGAWTWYAFLEIAVCLIYIFFRK